MTSAVVTEGRTVKEVIPDDEFNPRVRGVGLVGKFAFFVAITAIAMVAAEPILLGGLVIGSLVLMLGTGLKARVVLGALKPLAPVVIMLFVFSALFFDASAARTAPARTVLFTILDTEFVDLTLSVGGLLFGLAFVLKLFLMMAVSVYFIGTTPMEQLLAALQVLRIPNAIGLMMSTAVRFIPTMTSEVATIKDAQRARGAGSSFEKQGRGQAVQGTLPLFVPMIVTSMRRADTMAMSMVSRGYGFTKNRTVLTALRTGAWDYVLLALSIALVAAFFVFRATHGIGIL
jgi:energy-coupling factor transport system permease protein